MPIGFTIDDMNRVADQFIKSCDRYRKSPNASRTAVIDALNVFRERTTPGNLKLLIIRIDAWRKIAEGKDFSDCGGEALRKAIQEITKEVMTDPDPKGKPEPLEDGDILFRYIPHGIGQRGPMQRWIASSQNDQRVLQAQYRGSGIREVTQSPDHPDLLEYIFAKREPGNVSPSSIGQSWDLIQHVGIYTKARGVREIDIHGLSYNEVDKRKAGEDSSDEIDLVVRCDLAEKATKVSIITHSVNAKELGFGSFGQKFYPVGDLIKLALFDATTGGVFSETTRQKLHDLFFVHLKNKTMNQMAQAVVCSHFVHAVLWNAAEAMVTVRAATMHEFDNVFKISPSHLWRQFRKKQGVFDEPYLLASFKGIQTKGRLYKMEREDLKALGV
jgi:hypothetical protein